MLILASGSSIRQKLLASTGIKFKIIEPDVDEEPLQQRFSGQSAVAALELAKFKANSINSCNDLILGADQTLEFDGKIMNKPKSKADLSERLHTMSGKTHYLNGSYVLVHNSKIVWSHQSRNKLKMRTLNNHQIDNYLNMNDDNILKSVGGYHLEAIGLQLFDIIEGDFQSMQGLALLPLLNFLHQQNLVEIEGLI